MKRKFGFSRQYKREKIGKKEPKQMTRDTPPATINPREVSYPDRSRGIHFFTPTTKNFEFDIMPDYIDDTTKAPRYRKDRTPPADATTIENTDEDMEVDVLSLNDAPAVQVTQEAVNEPVSPQKRARLLHNARLRIKPRAKVPKNTKMKSTSTITLRERKPSKPIMKPVQGDLIQVEVKKGDVPKCEWKRASVNLKKIGKADDDEPIYYIEAIVDVRYVRTMKEYYVKWENWATEFNSWVKEDDVLDSVFRNGFLKKKKNQMLKKLKEIKRFHVRTEENSDSDSEV